MSPSTARALVRKYREAAQAIADAYGPLSLLGLFERRDNPGKLDLIIAAPWLNTDRNGLLSLVPYLPHLTLDEGAVIGRIVALSPDAEFVRAVGRLIPETGGYVAEVGEITVWDTDISRGYVIVSSNHPLPAQGHAAAVD